MAIFPKPAVAASQALSNQKMSPAATPKAPLPANRPSVAAIVQEWAAGLTPKNAPNPVQMGPLAWVRNEQVKVLLEKLREAGHG